MKGDMIYAGSEAAEKTDNFLLSDGFAGDDVVEFTALSKGAGRTGGRG